ncbi:MAG TPA: hypothetical protein VKZ98_11485 [Aquaticitalea sp.]|nr:hypothetical protein [Aquaticitalea sp.]
MKRTDQTNEPSVRKDYDKKILSVVHHLHPYVKQRLHVAESVGILPKNLYASNGIIDDSIIKLYEKGNDRDADVNCIKLKLFETIDDYLEDLFVKEAYHKKTISTSTLLQEELHRLEESFTIDADEDYMMLEELDDISYHQHDDEYEVFVFDDHNSKILNVLDLEASTQLDNRKLISKFYHWLPVRVANIVDLYTFGKLDFSEIAKIKHIEVSRVERILKQVKKRFRTHLE